MYLQCKWGSEFPQGVLGRGTEFRGAGLAEILFRYGLFLYPFLKN